MRVFTVTEKVKLYTDWKLYHFGRLDFLLISVDKRLANKTLYKANYFSLKTEVKVTDWAHTHLSIANQDVSRGAGLPLATKK